MKHLDPRIKILSSLALSVAALCAGHLRALTALLVISALILPICGITPAAVWYKLRGVFGLIAALFCVQCLFSRTGEAWLVLGGITIITVPGLSAAVLSCIRLVIIALGAVIASSIKARDFLLAITQCGIPYELAFTVLAALRFLPVLREEARDVLLAAQLRGLKIKNTGPRKRVGAYIRITLPVLSGAIRRAEQLSVAMEARAFRAFPSRTYMRRLQMSNIDWCYVIIFSASLTAVFMYLN